MVDERFPKPEEIEEFEEFVRKRFGDQVQVISQEVRSGEEQTKTWPRMLVNFKDLETVLEFDYKPKDVKEYLDRLWSVRMRRKKPYRLLFVTPNTLQLPSC